MTKTSWAHSNPFAPGEKKPEPKKQKKATSVDVDSLQISDEPFEVQSRPNNESKYQRIFSALQPGKCIRCKPEDAGRVKNALQKWLEVRKRDADFDVRFVQRHHSDNMGRVWLLPREKKCGVAA